ncbi:hypothetical protein DPMN_133659 [Dreissena polymorpha]|uniref:Uncharacterized protein n=1 Tax=Dreissena polymorpha TaxID=45954 RepID=A0A9D4JF14_DREPO|nr:hypothetical protein DPMN_133659 [Dreissena polymorpha]
MQLQKKCLFVLLNMIVVSCAREPSSPMCSKYDYEERLLKRVIGNELALETTLSEIMKTNAKFVEGLKQLEDEKAKVETTLSLVRSLKDQLKVPLIYFLANISSSTEI